MSRHARGTCSGGRNPRRHPVHVVALRIATLSTPPIMRFARTGALYIRAQCALCGIYATRDSTCGGVRRDAAASVHAILSRAVAARFRLCTQQCAKHAAHCIALQRMPLDCAHGTGAFSACRRGDAQAAAERVQQTACRRRRALKSRQRRWRIELREPQRQPRAEGEEYIYLRPHGAGVCRIVAARRVEPLRGGHRGARPSGTRVKSSRRAPLPHGIVAARINTRPACRTRSHTVGRARSPRLHH